MRIPVKLNTLNTTIGAQQYVITGVEFIRTAVRALNQTDPAILTIVTLDDGTEYTVMDTIYEVELAITSAVERFGPGVQT